MMSDYFKLMSRIWKLNRCHVSDDMNAAFKEVEKFYSGSRLIKYTSGKTFGPLGSWSIPEHWTVNKAVLKTISGEIIVDFKENPLRLYTYSPSFVGTVSRKELEDHLFYSIDNPEAIQFHFRNQYRPWNRKWGFSITHKEYLSLKDPEYYVEIDTSFHKGKMTQLEYTKKGYSTKGFILLGHFDHPAMVNDGLAGCIVANEVIRRLQTQNTRYSYTSLNTVEIVGTVAYCEFEPDKIENIIEGLFVAMSASKTALSYQTSSQPHASIIDQAIIHLLDIRYPGSVIKPFRELVGNDEVALETPGVNKRCGSITRWPYNNYHTHLDNIDNAYPQQMEEQILFILDVIDILECNSTISTHYVGLPCFSNPKLNLYLSPTQMSQSKVDIKIKNEFSDNVNPLDLAYIDNHPELLNPFMSKINTILADNSDGNLSVLQLAIKMKLPFKFVYNYLKKMESLTLIKLKFVDI